MLDSFLLLLFHKYAELLKRRFSDDFQEVCHSYPYCQLQVCHSFPSANCTSPSG